MYIGMTLLKRVGTHKKGAKLQVAEKDVAKWEKEGVAERTYPIKPTPKKKKKKAVAPAKGEQVQTETITPTNTN